MTDFCLNYLSCELIELSGRQNLSSTMFQLVQEALDKASEKRTTVMIAHRLSTIANAHQIVIMKSGSIAEIGIKLDHENIF